MIKITILNMSWSSFGNGLLGLIINPLFYWFFIYALLISVLRIKQERQHFGRKLTPLFAEISRTLFVSTAGFAVITVVFMYMELSLSIEAILLFTGITIVLSGLGILSAVYTLGLTYLVLFVGYILDGLFDWSFFTAHMLNSNILSALAILIGIFLILEAIALSNQMIKFPERIKSRRGLISAHYRLRRLLFVPFFAFVPITGTFSQIPFLPYLVTDTQAYLVLLVPFFFGFNYKVATEFTEVAVTRIRKRTLILGLITLMLGFSSLYLPLMSVITVAFAIIGREWLVYKENQKNQEKNNIFIPQRNGLKILSVLQDSIGEELGLVMGDTILKVNFEPVYSEESFHAALDKNTISFKFEVENHQGEKRFVHGSLKSRYGEAFGLIFSNVK